jgi:hypothetical protein
VKVITTSQPNSWARVIKFVVMCELVCVQELGRQ